MIVTEDGGMSMLSSRGYVMTVTEGMTGRPSSLFMPGGERGSSPGVVPPLARGGTGRNSSTSMSVDSDPSTRSHGSSEPEEDKLSDLESALWWEGFNTLRSPRRHGGQGYYSNGTGGYNLPGYNGGYMPPSPTSPGPDPPAQNGWGSPPKDLRQLQNLHISSSGGYTKDYSPRDYKDNNGYRETGGHRETGGYRDRFNTMSGPRRSKYDGRALSQSYDVSMTRSWDLGSRDLSSTHPPNPYSHTNGHSRGHDSPRRPESRGYKDPHPEPPSDYIDPREAFKTRSVSVMHEPGHTKPPQLQYVHSGPSSYPGTPREPGTPINGVGGSLSSSPGSDPPLSPRKTPWLKLHLNTISEKLFSRTSSKRKSKREAPISSRQEKFKRSNSVPDILDGRRGDTNDLGQSDADDDDYGFLSHPGIVMTSPARKNSSSTPVTPSVPSSPPPAGMQKSKSPTTALRASRINLNPKKWRKSKVPKAPSLWKPEGPCEWSSSAGQKVTLATSSVLSLSEIERVSLQKVALTKLQALNLGCAITIPKDWNHKRSKRGGFSLKRRTGSTGILENLKDKTKEKEAKEPGQPGWVFDIPLAKCIANDVELRRRKPSLLRERRESLDLPQFHRPSRKSSSSSVSRTSKRRSRKRSQTITVCQCSLIPYVHSTAFHSRHVHGGAVSSDSLSESDTRPGSNLLDALSLQSPHPSGGQHPSGGKEGDQLAHSLAHHSPQVPFIVNTCIKHLETYGLRVLGIFRIGSSKKRVRQMRDDFDQGKDVKLGDDQSPHDVGALLKEFFRELPDPLLTRDLYSAFIATRKIKSDPERLWALHLLVSLLPLANRDTLWALLGFLSTVVQHSTDSIDANGQELPGNKMDAHNLATLFGPNILHKAKGGDFQVETLERAEERKDVIAVVKEMIENYSVLYQLSGSLHDEVLRILQETNPEAVDILFKQRVHTHRGNEGDVLMAEGGDQRSIPQSPPGSSSPGSHGDPSTSNHGNTSNNSNHGNGGSSGNPGNMAMVRHLTEALRRDPPAPFRYPHPNPRASGRHRMSEVPQGSGDSPRGQAAYRLNVPDQEWHKGRSISPASPRVSPSPKAMKPAPELRVPGEGSAVRRSLGVPHGPGPSSHRNTLTVPTPSRSRDSGDNKSNSSMSSGYYPGSSRSGTNSPATPDTPMAPHTGPAPGKWYMETPPESPRGPPGHNPPSFVFTKDSTPRTSSLQRPLDISLPRGTASTGGPGGKQEAWQPDRDWNHWECHTQQHSEDFQEQETLV